MNIKGREIGAERPLVCVPVVEKSRKDIMREAHRLAAQPADMIEWRIDWYENSGDIENVCSVAKELAALFKEKILLCTFRSKSQGGEKEIKGEEYSLLLRRLARQKKADMLDVEVGEVENPQALIQELHSYGAVVVASEHDFAKTPSVEEMTKKLLQMKEQGADVAKLAVMPENRCDVLKLLAATVRVKEQFQEYPVITMSMGETGMISRVAGQFSGSCVTFAAAGKTSAPGQMPIEDVVTILDKISEGMGK